MPLGGTVPLLCEHCSCATDFAGYPATSSAICSCGHPIQKHDRQCEAQGCTQRVRADYADDFSYCLEHRREAVRTGVRP
jgi:hypothetical protein